VAQKIPLLPSVVRNAADIAITIPQRDQLILDAAAKLLPVYQKMYYDTNARLENTLRTLCACRLSNYEFIAKTPLQALEDELVFINQLPKGDGLVKGNERCFLNELKSIKTWRLQK